ncbi:MAG TPA: hypothetical protein VNA20_18590 [Frankiaceae bacterium]|nr:hypothetical protein [Frankiaceae bacterium]
MRRLRNIVTRKRGGAKRRWLLLAGAGAAGVAGWQLVRRRGAAQHEDDLTSDPGAGTGTAAGDPTAGLAMTDPNAVRTGIDLPGGGDGSTPARAEPVFGTTPDGGYLNGS